MFTRVVFFIFLASLAACGGGGGNKNNDDNNGGGSGWQSGVFLDADSFFARCQNPRSGTDPWTGNPFADVQGTTLDENNFLRSYSNDTYLWYDEITDRDPGLYNDPLAYFDLLKTFAKSASGSDKDRFHFTYDSQAYYDLAQGGVSAGYGAEWAVLSATPPRDIRIAYTEPDSPATTEGLERGAKILAIDGVDIDVDTQAGVDTLNAGLFPAGLGETHTFTVLDLGAAGSREVELTSAEITNAMVQNVKVLDTPTGRVGYMTFNYHRAPAEEELVDAINTLNAGLGIDDLVLDLRYNGGGFLAIASQLAYMIAGSVPTDGRTFELLQFNDKHPATNPVTGNPLSPTPFYTTTLDFSLPPGQALPTLDLPRVYVLAGSGTASASEAVINSLRGVDVEVILIGGMSTTGKPYGYYATDNCGTTYFTIQFRGVNEKNFGDYSDGFSPQNAVDPDATDDNFVGVKIPGCMVADDFEHALGDSGEARLATALAYRDGASCPAASSAIAASGAAKPGETQQWIDGVVPRSVWDSNRILRR